MVLDATSLSHVAELGSVDENTSVDGFLSFRSRESDCPSLFRLLSAFETPLLTKRDILFGSDLLLKDSLTY